LCDTNAQILWIEQGRKSQQPRNTTKSNSEKRAAGREATKISTKQQSQSPLEEAVRPIPLWMNKDQKQEGTKYAIAMQMSR